MDDAKIIKVTRHDPRDKVRKDFPIYTQEQAKELGIRTRDWRDVSETGDYGLTDDGYATELLGIWTGRSKRGHHSTLKTFSLGRIWQNRNATKQKLLFSERQAHFARWYSHPDGWTRREVTKSRAKNAVFAYVQYMLMGRAPDWNMIGQIYRPKQARPDLTARRLFKSDRIMLMVNATLQKILNSEGVNTTTIVQKMKKVIELAEKGGDLTNMRLQLKDLAEMLEMFPKSTKFDPFSQLPEAGVVDTLTDGEIAEQERIIEEKRRQRLIEGEKPIPDGL